MRVRGIAGLVVVLGVVRWRTTQYRITPERVELHSGWLRRQRRSVPRDRIRTVDLTARLEHRLFGLSVVMHGHTNLGVPTDAIDVAGQIVLGLGVLALIAWAARKQA